MIQVGDKIQLKANSPDGWLDSPGLKVLVKRIDKETVFFQCLNQKTEEPVKCSCGCNGEDGWFKYPEDAVWRHL